MSYAKCKCCGYLMWTYRGLLSCQFEKCRLHKRRAKNTAEQPPAE